jgi:predicted AAA+ superfamily ATPase
MAVYLITNVGKEFSYNSLKKTFGLGSVNSAISFVSFFEDSYMLFTISKFDYSIKKQIINPKKVYSIDTGGMGAAAYDTVCFTGKKLSEIVHQCRKVD